MIGADHALAWAVTSIRLPSIALLGSFLLLICFVCYAKHGRYLAEKKPSSPKLIRDDFDPRVFWVCDADCPNKIHVRFKRWWGIDRHVGFVLRYGDAANLTVVMKCKAYSSLRWYVHGIFRRKLEEIGSLGAAIVSTHSSDKQCGVLCVIDECDGDSWTRITEGIYSSPKSKPLGNDSFGDRENANKYAPNFGCDGKRHGSLLPNVKDEP